MEEDEQPPHQSQTLTLTQTQTTVVTRSTSGRLPLDTLLQIWSHLPPTSLYRLRTVCHLWNTSIISDPLLPNLLLSSLRPYPPPPTLLLILRHTPSEPIKHPDRPALVSTLPASSLFVGTTPVVANFPAHPLRNGFTPYSDSTLLVLPSPDRLSPLCCFASQRFFYLANPSINRFLRLSPPPDHPPSPSTAAFGFSPAQNRFSLVHIAGPTAHILDFGPGQAGSAAWRVVPVLAAGPVRGFGINIDNYFFWRCDDLGLGFVVYLEYERGRFGVIGPPEGNVGEEMMYERMYLVEFKGAVCAVDNFSRPPRMEVWVLHRKEMIEDDMGEVFYWVRKYNVLMTGMSRDEVYPFCDYYFYDEEEGDEEKRREKREVIVLCNKTRSRLYCYNVRSRSIRQVYKPKQRSFEQLALYTPGLFPLTSSSV
ncbi:hypothetical protein vseg_006711 [Gypsophila vaccaria]